MNINISGPVGAVASAISNVVVAGLELEETRLATMDPEIKKRFDHAWVTLYEDFAKFTHELMRPIVRPEKVTLTEKNPHNED